MWGQRLGGLRGVGDQCLGLVRGSVRGWDGGRCLGLLKGVRHWGGGQWSERGDAGEGARVRCGGAGRGSVPQGRRVQCPGSLSGGAGGNTTVSRLGISSWGCWGGGQCVGRGLQGPGDRVWGRDRAGVSLDGNSAGMGRGVLGVGRVERGGGRVAL